MAARGSRRQWKTLEFVNVGPEIIGGKEVAPLQLLQAQSVVPTPSSQGPLWIVGGFEGSNKKDSYFTTLFQKAVQSGVIQPLPEIFLTPLVNPACDPKNSSVNFKGISLLSDFPSADKGTESAQAFETKTLLRWAERIQPKAVVSFVTGPNLIRHNELVPSDVIYKLAELCERPSFLWGTEPEVLPGQGSRLGDWCQARGICWIEFSIEDSKKSFQEIAESDWKKHIGASLKWLCEGPRFDPPKEEESSLKHLIVPVLEMPPEFANL
jgi:hypothetical protein